MDSESVTNKIEMNRDNGDDENEMEVIMSVSSDGRVTQWMIRKGFESLGICVFFLLFQAPLVITLRGQLPKPVGRSPATNLT